MRARERVGINEQSLNTLTACCVKFFSCFDVAIEARVAWVVIQYAHALNRQGTSTVSPSAGLEPESMAVERMVLLVVW